MLRKLLLSAAKEWRLLLRDREGLAILFVMPVAFVIIMSLALQDFFRTDAAPRLPLVVLDGDHSALTRAIAHGIAVLPYFQLEIRDSKNFPQDVQSLRADVHHGKQRIALLLPPDLESQHEAALAKAQLNAVMAAPGRPAITVEVLADPTLRADHVQLARSALEGAIARVEMQRIYAHFSGTAFDPDAFRQADPRRGWLSLQGESGGAAPAPARPSATQQNVPAYCLLAMFLLVVPLSATFIRERDQGSLARLQSMPVPAWVVIGGKVLPYLLINLLQMALCLGVGRYLLPLLGGEPLSMGRSVAGVIALSLASGLAAIGFGLLVALYARTTEQATAFGATAILLMAALGGIMVPRMMMPQAMQAMAALSPMGWALDGFLDLFVRDAGLTDVLPALALVLAFALVCFGIAIRRYTLRIHLQ